MDTIDDQEDECDGRRTATVDYLAAIADEWWRSRHGEKCSYDRPSRFSHRTTSRFLVSTVNHGIFELTIDHRVVAG